MAVLRPGKKFEVLARNELPGAIMATPAALDGALFVRTEQAFYRLGQPRPVPAAAQSER